VFLGVYDMVQMYSTNFVPFPPNENPLILLFSEMLASALLFKAQLSFVHYSTVWIVVKPILGDSFKSKFKNYLKRHLLMSLKICFYIIWSQNHSWEKNYSFFMIIHFWVLNFKFNIPMKNIFLWLSKNNNLILNEYS